MRHAFIYINLLKTDLGLPFNEIVKILNNDNYRTREGEQYTEKQVLDIWNKRNTKYRMEYINYQKYKPSPSEVKAKQLMIKGPQISDKPKHEVLKEEQFHLIEQAYKAALIEAAEELNEKLHLKPPIDANGTVRRLIKRLIKIITSHNIQSNNLTEKTLNVLGGLLYHPNFPRAKKSKLIHT
jgi:hypothetical protein